VTIVLPVVVVGVPVDVVREVEEVVPGGGGGAI
jgi:hypothetical protein